MIKSRLLLVTALAVILAAVLSGCSADEPAASAPSPSTAASPIDLVQKLNPDAAFKSACTDKITAKMIDPSAADISYTPLSGEDGFRASVNLKTQGGGDIALEFTCRRNADGDVVSKLISD